MLEWIASFSAVFACFTSDRVTPPTLLPADTSVLIVCDDVAGLRTALGSLPIGVALASGDHDELAELVRGCGERLVRGAVPGVDPAALAAASPVAAFAALAFDQHGVRRSIIGLEWANGEPAGLLPLPEGGDSTQRGACKRVVGRWTLITESPEMGAVLDAVRQGTEPSLASRERFSSSSAKVDATASALRLWVDPDLVSFGFDDFNRPPLAAKAKTGAIAWSLRADNGYAATQLFLGRGAEPSALADEAPKPFENDWLKFVPQDARAFSVMQLALPTVVQEVAGSLSKDEATREAAGLLGEFAGLFGTRVVAVVPNAAQGMMPVLDAYFELGASEEAAQALDFVVGAIGAALGDENAIQRTTRDDGRVIYTFSAPPGLPFSAAVSFTIENEWLLVTTKTAEIAAMLGRVRGDAASDIRSNPRFAELYAHLTQGQPTYHGVSFVDPHAAVAEGRMAIASVVPSLAGMALGRPVELIVGESLLECIDAAPASVSLTRQDEKGWMTLRHGALLGELSLAWTTFGAAATYLPALIAANVAPVLERGRVTKATTDLKAFREAIRAYTETHGVPPTTLAELTRNDPANFDESYLADGDALIDPWGVPYVYVRHADGTWLLSSLGADRAVGGEGEAADIDLRPED
jgi:hypothetical protein